MLNPGTYMYRYYMYYHCMTMVSCLFSGMHEQSTHILEMSVDAFLNGIVNLCLD